MELIELEGRVYASPANLMPVGHIQDTLPPGFGPWFPPYALLGGRELGPVDVAFGFDSALQGITTQQADALAQQALLEWLAVIPLAAYTLPDPGPTYVPPAGQAFVRFDDAPLPAGIGADAWPPDGEPQQVTVSVGYTWSPETFHTAMLHEIGHNLGLDHNTSDDRSVIHAALAEDADSLQPDDIAGVQSLYGTR